MSQQYFEKRYRKWQMMDHRPKNPNNNAFPIKFDVGSTAVPIRFGDLKIKLKEEAFERDLSMHGLVRIIIDEYYQRKELMNIQAVKI